MRAALTVYRALLRLFPEAFRRQFGPSMESTFEEVASREGPYRALTRETLDIVPRAISARARRESRPIPTKGNAQVLELFYKDLVYATRSLVRSPLVTAISVISLALGIGANAAIFSLVDAVLVKPMPVAAPENLVTLYATRGSDRMPMNFSYPNFEDLASATDVFADVVAFQGAPLNMAFGSGEPELVWSEVVTASYFSGLGVPLERGRGFEPNEAFAVVLSHDFWRRRFGESESVVGEIVRINGRELTVVGVAGPGFTGAKLLGFTPELWVPVRAHEVVWPSIEDRLSRRTGGWLNVRARLSEGTSIEEARAALDLVASRLEAEHPEINRDLRLHVMPGGRKTEPFLAVMIGDVLPVASAVLFGVVGIVLLIACANVASLQLARSVSRRKELAVRLSLGASRARVVRQLLFESLLLSLGGGALGIVFGTILLRGALRLNPVMDFSVEYGVSLDARVLAFTAFVSIAAGLLAGLVPALRSARSDVNQTLREGTPSPRLSRRRKWVVIPQLALSLVALVSSGLLVQSFWNVRSLSPGFATEGLLLGSVNLELQGYDEPRSLAFQRQVLERLRQSPSVAAATLAFPLPLDAYTSGSTIFPDYADFVDEDEGLMVFYSTVGDGYFETIETPLIDGRAFDTRDTASSRRVAIVNETLARRFWPEDSAIGHTVRFRAEGEPIEIIGVARDGKYVTLGEEPRPYIFYPLAQETSSTVTLILRSRAGAQVDPASLEDALRREVRALDPTLPVYGVKSMEEFLTRSTVGPRALALGMSFFAGVALVLTVVGVYGLMSFLVTQRRRDIGIRMALGAGKSSVLSLFVKEAFVIVATGVGIGIPLAWASTRVVSNLLVGMEGSHVGPLLAVSVALVVVALAGSLLPSRRATELDPIVTLRHE